MQHGMQKIQVATDFSTRSDRAIRRAVLLAKHFGAACTLVHVVDEDQPKAIVDAAWQTASRLLRDQAATLSEVDGLDCDDVIVLGDPFDGLLQAAARIQPDVLLIGPHRRRALRNVFVGTTAERAVRASRWPVLKVDGVPTGRYRHVMIATDLSEGSATAARSAFALGLTHDVELSILHGFHTPAAALMTRASSTSEAIQNHVESEWKRASAELEGFLDGLELGYAKRLVRHIEASAAQLVVDTAHELQADLVVLGTSGRTGIARLALGSTAEAVLRLADFDVLAVPPHAAID